MKKPNPRSFTVFFLASLVLTIFTGCGAFRSKGKPLSGPGDYTQSEEVKGCTATREYVTTLEFFRSEKELALPEPEARKLASRVAQGCNGAAARFIRVTTVLSRAGVASQDAVSSGLKFTARTNREADAFVEIFKSAFLEDYLDLSLGDSVELAHSLTSALDGDQATILKDFDRLVEFCVSAKSLDLPKKTCATMASRLAQKGVSSRASVYDPFMKAFDFLRSSSGPNLITGEALRVAEELVAISRDSVDNFIQAYKYALSKDGLGMAHADAMSFAKEMASRTMPKTAAAN